jgi:putative Holliday junction resolvase
MEMGRRLAVDVGTVRIGLALCDPELILASPLPAIVRSENLAETLEAIASIAAESNALEIYVGDPVALSGQDTSSTRDAREFAASLAQVADSEVRLIDERLTTVSATSKLRQSGKDSRDSKALIDSASAVEILEQVIRSLKISGVSPGYVAGGSHA